MGVWGQSERAGWKGFGVSFQFILESPDPRPSHQSIPPSLPSCLHPSLPGPSLPPSLRPSIHTSIYLCLFTCMCSLDKVFQEVCA